MSRTQLIDDLLAVLDKSGVAVDDSLQGQMVPVGGRCWARYGSFTRGSGNTLSMVVTVAVSMNDDIGEVVDVLWDTLIAEGKDGEFVFVPTSVVWRYGSVPIPGRGTDVYDCADITVTTGFKYD